MQDLTLQTPENRIILRDSTETHPFQLERMSSFTGIPLSEPESTSPNLIFSNSVPEDATLLKRWENGELAFNRDSLVFYVTVYKKELLTTKFRSLVASWSMGLSAAFASAMLRGTNIIPVHGVLLDTPKGGLLFCGQGGVGKSTTARRWRKAGGNAPADDMVLLEYGDHEIAAHPLPTWSRCSESVEGEYFPFSKRIVLNRIFAIGRDPVKENIRTIPEWQYFMNILSACTLFTSYMTNLLPEPEQKRMLETVRGVASRLSGHFPPAGMFAHLDADLTQTLKDYL